MLLLTTTGARTGRTHTVALLYLDRPGGFVVIASYGGRPDHPQWYDNLVVDPDVTVDLPGRITQRMRARTATSEERSEWWPRIVEAYDGYAQYQSRTDREIPVVFLES